MIIRGILTGGIGLLLLVTYVAGSIVMGRAADKLEYVNLVSQSEGNGMTYDLAESIYKQNQESDEPLLYTNWRQDSGGQVAYGELDRIESAEILAVYGRTDLLFPSCDVIDVQSRTSCLISEELAFRLFGGIEVTGNTVEYRGREYEIIDVIDSEIPLFVYEPGKENTDIVLDRAVVRCIQKSPGQTLAEYNKIAGTWELVDYPTLFWLLKISYLAIPWILGIGVLLAIRKYKKEAKKISRNNEMGRKRCYSIKQYWLCNKEWIIWESVLVIFLLLMIIYTVVQIRIPPDMIPDQWSNFEFWSQYYKNKQEALLLIKTMKKGILDLSYLGMLYKAAGALAISVIEVGIFTKLVRKYVL